MEAASHGRRRRVADAAGLCVLAFLILLGYELSRSSVESLFLEAHGSAALPWAWLAVAGCVVGVVVLYDRLAAQLPLPRLFALVLVATGATLALLATLRAAGVPGASFLLYVWKDVHVVVLLEMLWTFASLVFPTRTARWVYGLFCAMGSLGGISGGLLAGAVAERFGTGVVLWLPLGVFTLLLAVVGGLGRRVEQRVSPAPRQRTAPGARQVVRLLRRSSYLTWMVVLVALVQLVVTLVDYQFNAAVEAAYADTDARTAVIGRVYAGINVGAITLQLLTGPILRAIGVPAALLGVPAALAGALAAFAVAPRLATVAITKIASKALDYSIFKAGKEMLYIPLPYAEKTRGKAVVDMLTYRVAKGGASALLGALVGAGLGALLPFLTLGLVACWLGVTWRIVRRYRALDSAPREAGTGDAERDPGAVPLSPEPS